MQTECVFCKIIKGIIPAEKIYEDNSMIIIKDIQPQAKIHLLLIPKEHYSDITNMTHEQAVILGSCLKKLGEIASNLGLSEGFRIISNKGLHGCQSVQHLHIHILGGEQLSPNMG